MVADPCEMVDPAERQRDMAGLGPIARVGRASGPGELALAMAGLGEGAAMLSWTGMPIECGLSRAVGGIWCTPAQSKQTMGSGRMTGSERRVNAVWRDAASAKQGERHGAAQLAGTSSSQQQPAEADAEVGVRCFAVSARSAADNNQEGQNIRGRL